MKYKTPIIETERLILKRGTYEDFLKVYEYNFTRLRDIAGEFEYVKNNPEEIKGFENLNDCDNTLDFIVYLKDTNTAIGNITFDRYKSENNSLELSYNTHPSYWRKGYTSEAVLNGMDYIFCNLDIDNIRCSFADDNIKSSSFAKKIGFKYVGSYTEHYIRIDKDIKSTSTVISKEEFFTKYFEHPIINYKIIDN